MVGAWGKLVVVGEWLVVVWGVCGGADGCGGGAVARWCGVVWRVPCLQLPTIAADSRRLRSSVCAIPDRSSQRWVSGESCWWWMSGWRWCVVFVVVLVVVVVVVLLGGAGWCGGCRVCNSRQ